ncbi:MAG: hypothetical protein HW416_2866 [Chloroflexi bacterium]|nr:hypothetical protein [Chloroflexota bacterium]
MASLSSYAPEATATRKADILRRLEDARSRTYQLLDPVSDDDLAKQHSPIMSPLVWDLGHIGNFEELWLVQELGERPPMDPSYNDIYDAFKHPRRDRIQLPLLDRRQCVEYLAAVRRDAAWTLEQADVEGRDPLTWDGFVFEMIIQHEYQHNETMPWPLRHGPGSCRAIHHGDRRPHGRL